MLAQVLDEIVAELFGELDKVDKGGEQNQCPSLFWCVQVLGAKVFYLRSLGKTAPRYCIRSEL